MQANGKIIGGLKRNSRRQRMGITMLVCFALSVFVWPTLHAYDTGLKTYNDLDSSSVYQSKDLNQHHGHSHGDKGMPELPVPSHSHDHDPSDHSHEVPIFLTNLHRGADIPPSSENSFYQYANKLGAIFDIERPPRS